MLVYPEKQMPISAMLFGRREPANAESLAVTGLSPNSKSAHDFG
jgi:hypothetical protein